MTDTLPISQAAREAAADTARAMGFSLDAAADIREGHKDYTPIVQAFQRAMSQAAADERECCARKCDAIAVECKQHEDHEEDMVAYGAEQSAAAIRSLPTEIEGEGDSQ